MKRRAVVIGVGQYQDEHIHALSGAVNDATEMQRQLVEYGDFEIKPEHFLLDKEATSDAIRGALSDLLWQDDEADLALLYFSGHGFQDSYGFGYLAPYDMQYDRPLVRGIRMQDLNAVVNSAVNKDVVVVILDACRSGIAAGQEKGGDGLSPGSLTDMLEIDEERLVGRGRYVFASSGGDEKSRERADCCHELGPVHPPHPHGAFTYFLLEGMNGGAAGANNRVHLEGLKTYVTERLGVRAGEQTPTFFGAGMQHASEIYLVQASQQAEIVRLLADAQGYLDEPGPEKLFLAIDTLVSLQAMAANHPDALALVGKVDIRLAAERGRPTAVLLSKKFDLLRTCPKCSRQITELVPTLTFDRLREVRNEIRALVLGLWQLALDQIDESEWMALMSAYEMTSYASQQMTIVGKTTR
jgi:hypothetical protein